VATDFLATDFLATDFLATNFLATDFQATDFLATDFLEAVIMLPRSWIKVLESELESLKHRTR
jgi:hypothetical protein